MRMEAVMPDRVRITATLLLLSVSLCFADERKNLLPAYVLQARTVLVIVDPQAGVPLGDFAGNRTAQENVEKEIMRWGRLKIALDAATVDMIVVVRKGNERVVNPTISGEPTNDRPATVEQTDGAVRIGAQKGTPPDLNSRVPRPQDSKPHLGTEAGPGEDVFSV